MRAMSNSLSLVLIVVAGILLTLYIMRRRARLGRRAPKF